MKLKNSLNEEIKILKRHDWIMWNKTGAIQTQRDSWIKQFGICEFNSSWDLAHRFFLIEC